MTMAVSRMCRDSTKKKWKKRYAPSYLLLTALIFFSFQINDSLMSVDAGMVPKESTGDAVCLLLPHIIYIKRFYSRMVMILLTQVVWPTQKFSQCKVMNARLKLALSDPTTHRAVETLFPWNQIKMQPLCISKNSRLRLRLLMLSSQRLSRMGIYLRKPSCAYVNLYRGNLALVTPMCAYPST